MPASALTVVELAERFMRVHVKAHCKPIAAKRAAGPTVGALAERFLEEYAEVRYKPGTLAWTRTVIRRYIVPELGKLPLTAVERAQVLAPHHRLHDAPSIANAVVRTLSLMYRLAADWGLVPEGCNPCRTVTRYPSHKRERFLTDEECTRLGQVLDEAETQGGASAPAVAAIRLLMLTGCRKSEILTLRWEHVALDGDVLAVHRIGELRVRRPQDCRAVDADRPRTSNAAGVESGASINAEGQRRHEDELLHALRHAMPPGVKVTGAADRQFDKCCAEVGPAR